MVTPVLETKLADFPVRRGKVRDIYDLDDQLLLVSTDRISAFDWVLPTGIPDKGRVLTQFSVFWFGHLDVSNHMLTTDLAEVDLPADTDLGIRRGTFDAGTKSKCCSDRMRGARLSGWIRLARVPADGRSLRHSTTDWFATGCSVGTADFYPGHERRDGA